MDNSLKKSEMLSESKKIQYFKKTLWLMANSVLLRKPNKQETRQ